MLFNSFTFAAFLVLVYTLYLMTLRRVRVQNAMLLVASYVFYGWWDWRFLGLIVLSTITDFICGWLLDRRVSNSPQDAAARYRHTPRGRMVVLWVSIAVNLGILGFFKYFDFFAENCAELLTAIGLPLQPRLLHVILPVGVSFYTFQTLSYTIDIYRGKLAATHSLLNFALFVGFFPQLVAGPIVRASEFLPQVSRARTLSLSKVYSGCYLIFWGLFKKIVIADNLAKLVDGMFSAEATPLGGAVLVAIYAFAIQIYCDFSGYTDIARGCARIMGFDLSLNFNLPYLATNPADFWRRWHISLSSWLRDYLYVPLGGNRKGGRRTCINLMLTMVLGGLWHGAAWTFVLWGAYQGVLLVAHRLCGPVVARWWPSDSGRFPRLRHAVAVVVFFQLVCVGWLIFRAESVGQIGAMLSSLGTPWCWWIISGANTIAGTGVVTLIAYSCPLLLMQLLQQRTGDLECLLRWPAWMRGVGYALVFYGLIFFGNVVDKPFIYFQF